MGDGRQDDDDRDTGTDAPRAPRVASRALRRGRHLRPSQAPPVLQPRNGEDDDHELDEPAPASLDWEDAPAAHPVGEQPPAPRRHPLHSRPPAPLFGIPAPPVPRGPSLEELARQARMGAGQDDEVPSQEPPEVPSIDLPEGHQDRFGDEAGAEPANEPSDETGEPAEAGRHERRDALQPPPFQETTLVSSRSLEEQHAVDYRHASIRVQEALAADREDVLRALADERPGDYPEGDEGHAEEGEGEEGYAEEGEGEEGYAEEGEGEEGYAEEGEGETEAGAPEPGGDREEEGEAEGDEEVRAEREPSPPAPAGEPPSEAPSSAAPMPPSAPSPVSVGAAPPLSRKEMREARKAVPRSPVLLRYGLGVVAVAGAVALAVVGRDYLRRDSEREARDLAASRGSGTPLTARPVYLPPAPPPPPSPTSSPTLDEIPSAPPGLPPSNDYDTCRRRTVELLSTHQFVAAEQWARKLIDLRPNEAFGYRCLGAALQDQGRLREARKAYSQCVTHARQGEVLECQRLGGVVQR